MLYLVSISPGCLTSIDLIRLFFVNVEVMCSGKTLLNWPEVKGYNINYLETGSYAIPFISLFETLRK